MTAQSPGAVPTSDLRGSLGPIRDQGQRGTCLAFAVTAAHEVARTSGSPSDDLSEEALYWGCKRSDGNWSHGTTFRSAATAIGRWGQPLEVAWPYDATRQEGQPYAPPTGPGGSSWFRSGLRRIAVNLADVRGYLDGGTPVVLGLTLFDTFFRPDHAGRIAVPPVGASSRGRHAIVAVGHQAGELLIRNSWGTTWALGGYAWILDTYIGAHADDAWIVDATVDVLDSASHRGDPQKGESYGTQ